MFEFQIIQLIESLNKRLKIRYFELIEMRMDKNNQTHQERSTVHIHSINVTIAVFHQLMHFQSNSPVWNLPDYRASIKKEQKINQQSNEKSQ